MRRKIAAAVILLTLIIIGYRFTQKTPGYFNIIYITGDSFRPNHLNCYGYTKRITSPNIDRLAAEGVLFEGMINPSGWTNQNLVSIFSSLESPIHKVVTRGRSIDPDWQLPLEILKDHGYLTPKLQSWQRDDNHNNLGFDDFVDSAPGEWVAANHDRRFFMFYQFLQPHLPYNSTETYVRQFVTDTMYQNDQHRRHIFRTIFSNYMLIKGEVEFKSEDREIMHALYDAEIRYMDDEIGKLLAVLDAYNLRDKTIIVIGADHGEELLEHGHVGHASTSHFGTLYDEIIHTPFIISLAKKLPANKRISGQVSGLDILPTILDLLNISIPNYLRGRSLLPVIAGTLPTQPVVYCETSRYGYGDPDPKNVTDYIRCVRTDDWKLIHYQYAEDVTRYELFDLRNDPAEQINVLDQYPDQAVEFKKLLFAWLLECEQLYPPKIFSGKFWQKKMIDLTDVPSPPTIMFPADRQVITYDDLADKRVTVSWNGRADVPYVIEYQVGKETYYLDGSLNVDGNVKTFGPFSRSYWDTYLLVRNPFRVRVSIDKEPREFSPWLEFTLK